jgi:hypothetical protein
MSLSKVIETARADLGYTENPPGSNMTKYGEAYGMNGVPWCVEALWFWFNEAGERMAFFGGGKTASCSMLLRWYKEQGLTVPVGHMQEGDIVLLNFNGKGTSDHCGLVTGVGYTAFDTIEGNTTSGLEGSQDNGGCVAAKRRHFSQIVAVCRPQYRPEPVTVDDITGHWYTDDVKWCIEHGFIKCYPDGSFKPDQPVTRAELAATIRRIKEG